LLEVIAERRGDANLEAEPPLALVDLADLSPADRVDSVEPLR